MTSKRILVFALALLVIALCGALLFACGSEEGATSETTTAATAAPAASGTTAAPSSDTTAVTAAPAAQFDGEIVLGAVATMTGMQAMAGAEQRWAQEQAVADINAAGGVDVGGKKMQLKLIFADDRSDSNEASAAAEKLIKMQGVKILLGTNSTPTNMAVATVAEKYKALLQTNYLWTNWAREGNFKFVCDTCFSPQTVGEVCYEMVDAMPEAERPKTWAILTEDNQDGQGLGEALKALAAAHGYEIKVYETYTPGAKDFSSPILKMKQNKIDAIVTLVSPADGITFVKQMKEQQFSPKFIFGLKGFWPIEFQEGLGPDAEYISYDAAWSDQLGYPGGAELQKKYMDAHPGVDSVTIGSAYSVVQVLKMAIERTGSLDPAILREEIAGGTFEGTVMGDLTYDEQGVNDVPVLGMQWVNGKRLLAYPGGEIQWFVPWDQR